MSIARPERGPAPDPGTATTRPGFAALLTDLMRWSGRSHRKIAQQSGTRFEQPISPTTAANLTAGTTVPAERSVVRFLRGCGLSEKQQEPWIARFRELYPRPSHRQATHPSKAGAGRTGVGASADSDLDWLGHFEPRARGVEYVTEPGSYFVGRRLAILKLTEWLTAATHPWQSVVVTGAPGSGKSALLGHLLARSRAQPGTDELTASIALAIHARRLTLEDLVTRIADGFGLSAASVPTLLLALARRAASATIMIDALDESGVAEGDEEHLRISRDLLRPLSVTPGVRLLVGGRRQTLAGLSLTFHRIELDRGDYADPEDIREYVGRMLADWGDRKTRPFVVNGIAHQAGASFLVARMTVEAVKGGQLDVDTSHEGWVQNLPTEAGPAFLSYLGRLGDREQLVRRLLTPLAYALGSGLPWDNVWAPIATAVSGRACADEDVQWLLDNAGTYIDQVTVADGTSRFRLYHDELSRALRDPRREREAQRRIAVALIATVPLQPDSGSPDWANAHPYVLAHLATHAAAAGEADNLIADVGFLCHAELASVLPALNQVRGDAGRTAGMVFRAVAVRHPDDFAEARRSCLAFEAARQGATDLLDALNRELPWPVYRAVATQDLGYRKVLGVEPAAVHLQCATVLDRQVLLTSSNNAALRMWDLAGGDELDSLGNLHSRGIPAFTSAIVAGRPVALTGDLDGVVRLWDLISGAPGAAWSAHQAAITAVRLATASEPPVGVTKDADGVVAAWDLNDGTRRAMFATGGRLPPMACLEVEGREAVAVIDADLTVKAWDLQSGELLGPLCDGGHDIGWVDTAVVDGQRLLLTVHVDGNARLWQPGARAVRASVGELGGEVTRISVWCDDTLALAVIAIRNVGLQVWDLLSGASHLIQARPDETAYALTCCLIDDAPAAITVNQDGVLRAWDLLRPDDAEHATGDPGVRTVASFASTNGSMVVTGHMDGSVATWRGNDHDGRYRIHSATQAVTHLAAGATRQGGVVLGGSADGSAWLWSGDLTAEPHRLGPVAEPVTAVTVADTSAGMLAFVADGQGTVRSWDVTSGAEGTPMGPHDNGVNTLAVLEADGGPRLATADGNTGIRVWTLSGEVVTIPGSAWVNALAGGSVAGQPWLVSADADGVVRLWDPDRHTCLAELPDPHDGPIAQLSFAELPGGPVAVTGDRLGRVQVWDLARRQAGDTIWLPAACSGLALSPDGALAIVCEGEVFILHRRPE